MLNCTDVFDLSHVLTHKHFWSLESLRFQSPESNNIFGFHLDFGTEGTLGQLPPLSMTSS